MRAGLAEVHGGGGASVQHDYDVESSGDAQGRAGRPLDAALRHRLQPRRGESPLNPISPSRVCASRYPPINSVQACLITY